jgi:hypothetical protein
MLSLLLALAVAQTPQPDFIANPKLPIDKYVLPAIGGEGEIVTGLKDLETQFYTYYAVHTESFTAKGNMNFNNPGYDVQDEVGTVDWSVAHYPWQGKPAVLLQTNGLYKQSMDIGRHRTLGFTNRIKVSYWVAPDGTLLEMDSLIKVSAGNWTMQALFNKDSYDLTLNDPVNGVRKSTLNLGFPLDKMNAMFTPMLDGKKELLKEKDYYALDPLTGHPVHYVAKLGGHWDGTYFGKKKAGGRYVDVTGNGTRQRIYVSDEGVLFKVDEPGRHFIGISDQPG